MRTCGNSNCKNFGKSWDIKHHSICPYCKEDLKCKGCKKLLSIAICGGYCKDCIIKQVGEIINSYFPDEAIESLITKEGIKRLKEKIKKLGDDL